jgi:hypothetical protein
MCSRLRLIGAWATLLVLLSSPVMPAFADGAGGNDGRCGDSEPTPICTGSEPKPISTG